METPLYTHNLGFPRIGEKRELKKATETYWAGKLDVKGLEAVGAEIRKTNWRLQQAAGINLIPSNDFSFYDQMLDMTCLLGNVPARFGWNGGAIDLALLFKMARGTGDTHHGCTCESTSATQACEMTKWFDTNYHYIVPEFHPETRFKLSSSKPFDEFVEAEALGIMTKPVLIGPMTYLYLGKSHEEGFDRLTLLERLLPVYEEILSRLAGQGAAWIQLDEPILALDLRGEWQAAFAKCYDHLRSFVPETKLLLSTYFGGLRENLPVATGLAVDALHIDATRAGEELDQILSAVGEGMQLSLGVVDGRNIWKNAFEHSAELLRKATAALGRDRVWVAPSCSLLHAPVTLRHEAVLDQELKGWLAFSEEKLVEVATLARLGTSAHDPQALHQNQVAIRSRRSSERIHPGTLSNHSYEAAVPRGVPVHQSESHEYQQPPNPALRRAPPSRSGGPFRFAAGHRAQSSIAG